MADNGVVSTLLPTTAFCLKEPFARAREMIDAGCAVALATDFNPGSGFTFSVPLMIGLAVIYMKISGGPVSLPAALAQQKGVLHIGCSTPFFSFFSVYIIIVLITMTI